MRAHKSPVLSFSLEIDDYIMELLALSHRYLAALPIIRRAPYKAWEAERRNAAGYRRPWFMDSSDEEESQTDADLVF